MLIGCTPVLPDAQSVTLEATGESGVLVPLTKPSPQASATHVEDPSLVAARVNGEVITIHEYERDVLRYEAGLEVLGWDPATQGNYQVTVLEQMINECLIVQAAESLGYKLEDSKLEAALDESVAARGGAAGFNEWLELNKYTREEFLGDFHDQLLSSMVQEDIVSKVPQRAEQVRARHILVATLDEAYGLIEELDAGADFATLAIKHSLDHSTRINGGDLGWFPTGFLTVPKLELAAFTQELNERSGVISTFLGFHLLETLDRDPDRPLSPEAYLRLQQDAVEDWLVELRDQAIIERYIP